MRLLNIFRFLDADHASAPLSALKDTPHRMTPGRWLPFVFLHASCLLVFLVGYSTEALLLCIFLYAVRMFAITGFYHRYFSHRSFKTSRLAQFLFALLGACAVQRGPLWWAAHHRDHHRLSDKEGDVHSPVKDSFIWSHIGWITSNKNIPTDYGKVSDLSKFPELVFINRYDWLPPVVLAVIVYTIGEFLHLSNPGVSGAQFVVWGLISTVILFHATCSINSVGHLFGTRRFETPDASKNNLALALVTFGEGWHNNHHRFPGVAKQGYAWYEIDITFYILKLLERLGIVWNVSSPVQASQVASSARESLLHPTKVKGNVEQP